MLISNGMPTSCRSAAKYAIGAFLAIQFTSPASTPGAEAPGSSDASADTLTLPQCLQRAYRNNLDHLIDLAALVASRERLRQARSPFELNVNADLTLPSYSESRDIIDNEALLARIRQEDTRLDYEGRVSLSQRLRNIGELSIIGSGFRNDFSSNRRQDFREYSADLSFAYEQEILTEPEEELRLRGAELSYAAGRSALRRQRAQLETRVVNAYYDLVQGARQLEIQKQRLEQSQAALELAKRKFEIGLIAEVEALRLQVDELRAQAEYAEAATRIESRRDALRQVLAMDMDTPLAVSTSVDFAILTVDEEAAVAMGLARRTDMEQQRLRQRIARIDLQRIAQSMGPSASLNARVNLTGRGPDPDDVGRTLERSLISANLRVALPLVDGGRRRGVVRQAEIDLRRMELTVEQVRRQVVLEVREAVRSVQEAERQIRLLNSALEVAERTFEVEQSRFELGLANSQELLDAQTDLTQARTSALNAVVSYQRALQDLRLATMAEPKELVAGDG